MKINVNKDDIRELYNKAVELTSPDSANGSDLSIDELNELRELAEQSGDKLTSTEKKFLDALEHKINVAKISAIGESDSNFSLELENSDIDAINVNVDEIKERYDFLESKGYDIKGKIDNTVNTLLKEDFIISNDQFKKLIEAKDSGKISSNDFKNISKLITNSNDSLSKLSFDQLLKLNEIVEKYGSKQTEDIIDLVTSSIHFKGDKDDEGANFMGVKSREMTSTETDFVLNLLENGEKKQFDNLERFISRNLQGSGLFSNDEITQINPDTLKWVANSDKGAKVYASVLKSIFEQEPPESMNPLEFTMINLIKNHSDKPNNTADIMNKIYDNFFTSEDKSKAFLELVGNDFSTSFETASTLMFTRGVNMEDSEAVEIFNNHIAKGRDKGDALAAVQAYATAKDALDRGIQTENLPDVMKEIKEGNIRVDDDTKLNLPKNTYMYSSKKDTVYLKGFDINNLSQRAVLLHELIHASHDEDKLDMKNVETEAISYGVQYEYMLSYNSDLGKDESKLPTATTDDRLHTSAILYARALKSGVGVDEALENLKTALKEHKLYKSSANKSYKTDGIEHDH